MEKKIFHKNISVVKKYDLFRLTFEHWRCIIILIYKKFGINKFWKNNLDNFVLYNLPEIKKDWIIFVFLTKPPILCEFLFCLFLDLSSHEIDANVNH